MINFVSEHSIYIRCNYTEYSCRDDLFKPGSREYRDLEFNYHGCPTVPQLASSEMVSEINVDWEEKVPRSLNIADGLSLDRLNRCKKRLVQRDSVN